MQIKRILVHLLYPGWWVRYRFSRPGLARIEAAVAKAESGHHGEIAVAIEPALGIVPLLRGTTCRERALQVFAEHRLWDTEANNGVLIYLLLADKTVEIIADRGVARQVDPAEWQALTEDILRHCQAGDFNTGILAAIDKAGGILRRLYPTTGVDQNEVPNRPILL